MKGAHYIPQIIVRNHFAFTIFVLSITAKPPNIDPPVGGGGYFSTGSKGGYIRVPKKLQTPKKIAPAALKRVFVYYFVFYLVKKRFKFNKEQF